MLLIEGESGIGKTALLEAVAARARARKAAVLRGRGGELERDFSHGVVRQLYEPLVRESPARRRRLMRGAAELAAEGLSNVDFAQALFVTKKTVETHLGHVYRKLDIASREQLEQAMLGAT